VEALNLFGNFRVLCGLLVGLVMFANLSEARFVAEGVDHNMYIHKSWIVGLGQELVIANECSGLAFFGKR
jgi:hypothetical protein